MKCFLTGYKVRRTFPELKELPDIREFPNIGDPNIVHENQCPHPREDLESRTPNLGPYTTKGSL